MIKSVAVIGVCIFKRTLNTGKITKFNSVKLKRERFVHVLLPKSSSFLKEQNISNTAEILSYFQFFLEVNCPILYKTYSHLSLRVVCALTGIKEW